MKTKKMLIKKKRLSEIIAASVANQLRLWQEQKGITPEIPQIDHNAILYQINGQLK